MSNNFDCKGKRGLYLDGYVIAFNLDGTILKEGYPEFGELGELKEGALEALKTIKDWGCRIVIWTCRNSKDEIADYLNELGVPYDAINDNSALTAEEMAVFDDNDSRKIGADVYVDSKGLRFTDWSTTIGFLEVLVRESFGCIGKKGGLVGVDLDKTILKEAYPEFGELKEGALEALKTIKDWGCRIVIWTCRCNEKEVANHLDKLGVPYDAINDNSVLTGTEKERTGGNSRKVFADVYVDDKGLRFVDWGSTLDLLKIILD